MENIPFPGVDLQSADLQKQLQALRASIGAALDTEVDQSLRDDLNSSLDSLVSQTKTLEEQYLKDLAEMEAKGAEVKQAAQVDLQKIEAAGAAQARAPAAEKPEQLPDPTLGKRLGRELYGRFIAPLPGPRPVMDADPNALKRWAGTASSIYARVEPASPESPAPTASEPPPSEQPKPGAPPDVSLWTWLDRSQSVPPKTPPGNHGGDDPKSDRQ